MSSNHRDGKDFNEQPQVVCCQRCKRLSMGYAHGEFCSEKCWIEHHRAVIAFHEETLRIRKDGQ